jgi:hypothetical protein
LRLCNITLLMVLLTSSVLEREGSVDHGNRSQVSDRIAKSSLVN